MYADIKPCGSCGADVELRARESSARRSEPDPDGTVDARVCTNPECATNVTAPTEPPLP